VTRRPALAVAMALAVTLTATVGGCGLPSDDGPQAIPKDDLPADLLDPNPSSSTTNPSMSGESTVQVYLLGDSGDGVRLVAVDRQVNESDTPNERLAALFGGATDLESAGELSTGIPADTVLLDVHTDDEENEVVVNVSDDLFTVEGEALAQAFAQIVWTATEPDGGGYTRVRFQIDGETTPVLDVDGTEHEGAVTRADYDSLAPLLE